ncbi:hypothetical protein AX16_004176 [Volvariella volvacea WC 439]|nr:hypothetical protein AX16_004176 [Volvariella volvacea WC 439]
MKLLLSKSSHLSADYTNEAGELLYRARKNSQLWTTTTNISKRIPPTAPHLSSGSRRVGEGKRTRVHDQVQDQFAHLAQVYFRQYGSDKIVMGGQKFYVSSFFRKEGLSWGGRDRIFTGPDGKEYRWILGYWEPKLVLNDRSKAVVAVFHKEVFGFFHNPENVYLEIMPNGEHMIDLILITFIYIEELRKASDSSGGVIVGGGGGGGGGGGDGS